MAIRVKCNDCGFQGEIQERRINKRTQCPKCGLLGLEYDRKEERVISGRARIKELVQQGKSKREIRLLLEDYLSPISIDEYYSQSRRELGLSQLVSGAPLGNKNAGNRKKGQKRYCLDCGEEIYVTRYRIEHAKNMNVGRRCSPCAIKWVITNRKKYTHRLTAKAITKHIEWIKETFSKDKPEQVKYGISLACASMLNFIESKSNRGR